jgi:hypothetical protein
VLARYRTRMLTAEGTTTFDEPSPRWARFYAQHGWAAEASQDAPQPPPRRRGRPPKAMTEPEPEPTAPEPAAPEPEPSAPEPEDPFTGVNVPELREMAEAQGYELETRYYTRDELIRMLKGD